MASDLNTSVADLLADRQLVRSILLYHLVPRALAPKQLSSTPTLPTFWKGQVLYGLKQVRREGGGAGAMTSLCTQPARNQAMAADAAGSNWLSARSTERRLEQGRMGGRGSVRAGGSTCVCACALVCVWTGCLARQKAGDEDACCRLACRLAQAMPHPTTCLSRAAPLACATAACMPPHNPPNPKPQTPKHQGSVSGESGTDSKILRSVAVCDSWIYYLSYPLLPATSLDKLPAFEELVNGGLPPAAAAAGGAAEAAVAKKACSANTTLWDSLVQAKLNLTLTSR